MKRIFSLLLAPAALALALVISSPAVAGDAQDYLQARQTELTSILRQPASPARSQKVSTLLDSMFDYDKLATDSLGKNAEGRSESEMREFKDLLKTLVRRSYQKNIEKTLNYQVTWLGESGGGDQILIRTTAKTTKTGNAEEISINYKLHKRDGQWAIGDVITEESSLVGTYRNQFNRTINKDGWDGLIRKLKNKVANNSSS